MTRRISKTFMPTNGTSIVVENGTLAFVSAEGFKLELAAVSHKALNELEAAIYKTNLHQFPGNFAMRVVNGGAELPYFGKKDRTEKEADSSERGRTL